MWIMVIRVDCTLLLCKWKCVIWSRRLGETASTNYAAEAATWRVFSHCSTAFEIGPSTGSKHVAQTGTCSAWRRLSVPLPSERSRTGSHSNRAEERRRSGQDQHIYR